MAERDDEEFVDYATRTHSIRVTGDGSIADFQCSHGDIQFLRSQRFGGILTAGRIALATTDLDGHGLYPDSASALVRIYKQMRRWLQTRYCNRLVCYSEFFPVGQRKVQPARMFWLGPHAKSWLEKEPDSVLRQFRDGRVIFDLETRYDTTVV
ncbi:MAG: hypothetical protein AB1705_20170 [Verrucomicrobiota bacterium]